MPNAESKATLKTWAQALPAEGVVLIFGHRGEGKSVLAWWLASRLHKRGKEISCLGMPRQARRHFPNWINHLSDYRMLQRHRSLLVIVDEAAFQASARRHQSPENVAWLRLVAVCRHSHHLLLFVTQSNRSLDVGLVSEADIVCFKRPSILHKRFSRAELREDVDEAYEQLKIRKGKGWTFVKEYRDGLAGLLRNTCPSWWSEMASEAFALVQLDRREGEGAGARPFHDKRSKASPSSRCGSPRRT